MGTNGTPETNPLSTAYCPFVRNYFCGGFNGGTSQAFLKMAETIKDCPDPLIKHVLYMILVKVSRLAVAPSHVDSLVDIAGYARTGAMVLERQK